MGFSLVAPERVEEACEILSAAAPGEVAVLAGGTDLLLDIDEGRADPRRVLSLRRLPWNRHRWDGDALVIGSTCPLSDLESDPAFRARLPGLWQAVHAVGSLALRHRATVGGNLGRSSPASDLIPALLSLDARVELVGTAGRRSMPVEEFVRASRTTALRDGELIEAVAIPEPRRCQYVWQRVRPANDISQVGVAVALSSFHPHWRIALGGVSPRPLRLRSAESLLRSPSPPAAEVDAAAEEASQRAPFITDKRATEPYRRRLVSILVRRAVRGVAALPFVGDPR